MNIKDYIHLYLGCEVKNMEGGTMRYIFCGIDFDGTPKFKTIPSGFAMYLSEWKPILRPLSDMTRDEEDEVAKLCFGDDDFIITYRGMGYDDKVHQSVKCLKVETFCEHPEINTWLPAALVQLDHEDTLCPIIIGRFENNGKVLKDDVIEKPFDLTHYLLKQHFDLFGLIENNLAIDATTNAQ